MIVLTNPVSSGASLLQAFNESTDDTVALFTEGLAPGRMTGRMLSHRDLGETCQALAVLGAEFVVAASEFGVALADALSDKLGLPGNLPMFAAARRDKYLMARAFVDADVPVGRVAVITANYEIDDFLDTFTFPVVVKPIDSAGSDGCRICPDRQSARRACELILGTRNLMGLENNTVLVQEYLRGPQFIFNTVSIAGRHLLSDYYRCRVDETDDGAPVYRHQVSPRVLDADDDDIIRHTLQCLDALGIREGAAHTEVRMTSDGPRTVEVNSRVMGPCLQPDAYFAALGSSHQHLTAERFLDPDAFALRFGQPYRPRMHLAKVFLRAHREGTITAIPGLSELRRLPNLHQVVGVPGAGTPVRDRLLTTGASGIAFLVDEDRGRLEESLAVVHEIEDSGKFFEIQ